MKKKYLHHLLCNRVKSTGSTVQSWNTYLLLVGFGCTWYFKLIFVWFDVLFTLQNDTCITIASFDKASEVICENLPSSVIIILFSEFRNTRNAQESAHSTLLFKKLNVIIYWMFWWFLSVACRQAQPPVCTTSWWRRTWHLAPGTWARTLRRAWLAPRRDHFAAMFI